MRGLCGWFSGPPNEDGLESLIAMLNAGGSSAQSVERKTVPHAAMGVSGDTARLRLVEKDGLLLAITGHPRLDRSGTQTTVVLALVEAIRSRGPEALSSLGGDFALAAWNPATMRGLLAVDRMGVHQLVYAPAGNALAFATTLDALAGYPGVRRQLSEQAIFDYLYFHVCPGPQTIFRDLLRVPPAHYVEFGRGTASPPRAYWSMQFREVRNLDLQVLNSTFVELVETAVRDSASPAASGAFLSGGTDSSTISGMLGRVTGEPPRTFSIGFDVTRYDEMEYARLAARHFGCEHREYYVTPADVVSAVPKIAAHYDQPFGNASAIPTYYCARLARDHGITHLLAGDGGDELFGGNTRYAKQHLLSLYQRVPERLRQALIEPLLLSSPAIESVPLLRKLRSYVVQARPAMPQRYESYNLLDRLGATNMLTSDFLAAIDRDHPHRLLQDAHAPYAGASLINQMLGIDFRFILADGDLPKVTRMCGLAGVDVSFPMLDERLVEFSAALPSDMKLRGTQLRWFFKQALSGFLPPAVIDKKKHGFGLPVGAWLTGHKPLFDLAVDSIQSLRPRGIVRDQCIDELLGPRLREHPDYFGTMIWILMMLGLWLDSRKL